MFWAAPPHVTRILAQYVVSAKYDDLPANARKYLERLQALVGVPITIISTGPDREQTIIRQNPFA